MARTKPSASDPDSILRAPAPRFAGTWAALVYALCALSLAYPALSGQFLVNANGDQYTAGFAAIVASLCAVAVGALAEARGQGKALHA